MVDYKIGMQNYSLSEMSAIYGIVLIGDGRLMADLRFIYKLINEMIMC